jgi:hypothetical protein
MGMLNDDYLGSLERAPLLKKLDLIFSLCRPSPTFVGINENYRYDRERIIALENHATTMCIHGGLGSRLPHGDDDLSYARVPTIPTSAEAEADN